MVAQPSHAPKYGPIAQLGAHAVLKQSGVIYHAPPSGFWGLKYGLVAQLGAHAVLKQSGVIYHAPPSGFWGLKYGLVAQLGERSVRIRKVEGSTPFESIKRRIVLSDTAFLFAFLCKIVHHSS